MNIFCYQYHINDFNRDTSHLTHEQKGVYQSLINAYYLAHGNLTADLNILGRVINTQTDSERSALAHVAGNFFTVLNGSLCHKRCDEEIEKIKRISRQNSRAAKIKSMKSKDKTTMRSHSERTADAYANGVPTKNQEPRTNLIIKGGKKNGFAKHENPTDRAIERIKEKILNGTLDA